MTLNSKVYYRVAVTDGTQSDRKTPVVTYDCGHNHRTERAAMACREALLGWDKDHKNCSAKWYTSDIIATLRDGSALPPEQSPWPYPAVDDQGNEL